MTSDDQKVIRCRGKIQKMKFKNLTTTFVMLAVIATSFPGIFYPKKAEAQFLELASMLAAGANAAVASVAANPLLYAIAVNTGATAVNTLAAVPPAVTTAAATVGTAANTATGNTQTFLEWAKSFALSVLKRQILDVMVDQIVNWIQNGGEPRFITDWDKFFADVGQVAVGEFVQNIGAGFLCAPFSLQVRVGLLPVEKFGRNSPYACTLDQIVGNVENFYKDFRNGGWIAYEEAGKLQNNYYGALWMSWYGRDQFVASKLAAANAKISANKGFLSVELCRDKKTGLKVSGDELKQRQLASTLAGGGLGGGIAYSAMSDVVCEDTTPGGFVGATLEKAAGIDLDFIVNAQQLGNYAAAITNALINRMIKEGVNGLRGVTGGQAQTGDTPAYYRAGDLPANLRNTGNDYDSGNFAGLHSQITGAISDRKVAQANYTVIINQEKTLLAAFQNLKVCLVGTFNPLLTTTLASISDQNTAIATLQAKIDQNISEISALKNALAEVNSQSNLEFSSASLAQMTADVNAATTLRNETSSLVEISKADFETRNNAVLADQKIYCK